MLWGGASLSCCAALGARTRRVLTRPHAAWGCIQHSATPLHARCTGFHAMLSTAEAVLLLERGADIEAKDVRSPRCAAPLQLRLTLATVAQRGYTPLHCVAASGGGITVTMLVQRGADNATQATANGGVFFPTTPGTRPRAWPGSSPPRCALHATRRGRGAVPLLCRCARAEQRSQRHATPYRGAGGQEADGGGVQRRDARRDAHR